MLETDQDVHTLFNRKSVRNALKLWDNLQKLGEHPLTQLEIVEKQRLTKNRIITPIELGLSLRETLRKAIDELRDKDGNPDYKDKRWYDYIILTEEFIKGRESDYLAAQFSISLRTYQNLQGEAIDKLAGILYQWEEEITRNQPIQDEPLSPLHRSTSQPNSLTDLPIQDDVQLPIVQQKAVVEQIFTNKLHTLTISLMLASLALLSIIIFVANRGSSYSASSEQTTIKEGTFSTAPIITSTTVPTFTCWTYNFAGYYSLLQIKQEQIDLLNGFKLELYPYYLPTSDNRYMDDLTEFHQRMKAGKWDCMMDTLESLARHGNYGAITAIIDESAGADQVWARKEIKTINDIKGKKISFIPDTLSEFIFYTILKLLQLRATDINLVPVEDMGEAIEKFKQGETDVVIGDEPGILGLKRYEAHKVLDSSDLRFAVDVIVISHQAIDRTPELVQAFHRAWFQTLKRQFDNLPASAQSIAAWGNNDWTGISQDSSDTDLSALLQNIAQAGYGPNLFIMQNPSILYDRLRHTRSIWSLAYNPLPSFEIEAAVDPRFVRALKGDISIIPERQPLNNSFIMSGQPPYPTFPGGKILAVLPCDKFNFLSDEDSILSKNAQRELDECVVPVLKISRLYLKITGSSAWPGPPGTYSEATIAEFAHNRALAIAQYLANQGIDPERLLVNFTLPPVARREISLESELEKDRFVKLELVTGQK